MTCISVVDAILRNRFLKGIDLIKWILEQNGTILSVLLDLGDCRKPNPCCLREPVGPKFSLSAVPITL